VTGSVCCGVSCAAACTGARARLSDAGTHPHHIQRCTFAPVCYFVTHAHPANAPLTRTTQSQEGYRTGVMLDSCGLFQPQNSPSVLGMSLEVSLCSLRAPCVFGCLIPSWIMMAVGLLCASFTFRPGLRSPGAGPLSLLTTVKLFTACAVSIMLAGDCSPVQVVDGA